MASFRTLTSRVVHLPANDVDTDQIIPARFLKGTARSGLGAHLFADWRAAPEFVLNRPEAKEAQVLLAGRNFGCGSSREHAPWALVDFGFRAIVAESFADIFRQNALKNGLLPVALGAEQTAAIAALVQASSAATLTIDLETSRVSLPDGRTFDFTIDPFARSCLLQGVDELGYLLSFDDRIAAFEAARESR